MGKNTLRIFAIGCACLAEAAGSAPGLAGSLPPGGGASLPTGYAAIFWDSAALPVQSGPGTYLGTQSAGDALGISAIQRWYAGGLATGTIGANEQYLAVSDTITYSYLNVYDAIAADIQYYFQVVGPGSTATLEVQAQGYASPLAQGSSFGNGAEFYLTDPFGNILARNPTGGGAGGWSIDKTLDLQVGATYGVFMAVGAYNGPVGGGASAWVDPILTVSSATPDAAAYSILYSAGVGQEIAFAAPEPSTWAMMLIGCASLGFAFHRRGKKEGLARAA